MSANSTTTGGKNEPRPREIWKVIEASSAGTMIEWYDFYIFGSLGGDHIRRLLPCRSVF